MNMPRRTRITLGSALLCATVAIVSTGSVAVGAAHNPTRVKTTDVAAKTGASLYEKPSHVPYTPTGKADPRPNIVFITTDDETEYDMQWMPKTRHWLGDGGVEFPNMLSPHPLCCPARAEMITGQFAQNNGVHSNTGPYGGLPALKDPDNTLPWWLQQAHYQTGMVGKYLNQYGVSDGVPRGWDYWNAATTNAFGYYGYSMYNNGDPKRYSANTDAEYSTNVITADTTRMIQQYSQDERPFFIWSSYYAPHGICGGGEGDCKQPPASSHQYAHALGNVKAPSISKPSFNEKNMSDKPPGLLDLAHGVTKGDAQHLFTQRIRALQSVDDGVDATMKALQAAGELDNTIVIFTSDNGYLIGEHRYKGKVMPYEEALQVPLYVRGPGVPVGQTRPQTATMVDIAETIQDYAGISPGRVQDGQSLVPYIKSASTPRPDTTILIQAGGKGSKPTTDAWEYRGVRTGRYTYVDWTDGFTELYDRDNDKYELHNVADDPAYADVVKELHRRTEVLKGCSGSACRPVFDDLHGLIIHNR